MGLVIFGVFFASLYIAKGVERDGWNGIRCMNKAWYWNKKKSLAQH